MSKIDIRKIGITKLNVDAIVNAANSRLQAGGGVCGAIFREAGHKELQDACDRIGHCNTGSAVITPAFGLKARYIIHAVGPIWNGGNQKEPQLLYSCYRESLRLAVQHGCHSIAFPLISAGIFGYPRDKAWRKALQACQDFIGENTDADIDIIFAVLDDEILELGYRTMQELEIKETEVSYAKQVEFCFRYIPLLQMIEWDDELKEWCHQYSAYEPTKGHKGLERMIYSTFMQEAYDVGMVMPNYQAIIDKIGASWNTIAKPTDEFISTLTAEQKLACISWCFRRDHFSEGSLIYESIADGTLLLYFKALGVQRNN